MKEFDVVITYHCNKTVRVIAENEEEAIDKAEFDRPIYKDGNVKLYCISAFDVEETEKLENES